MEGEKNGHESKSNPVSINGRLLLKLKIPKSTEGTEEVAEMVVSLAKKGHICHTCNKGFSSGKAFGGHISITHTQAKDGSSSDASTNETVCSICGKDFPSKKSLFGHMRCHPDREWRGMEPPKEQQEKITRHLSRSLSIDEEEESMEPPKEQQENITCHLSRSLFIDDDDDEEEEEESMKPPKEQHEQITCYLPRSLSIDDDEEGEESMETDSQADYHVDAADDHKAGTLTTVEDLVDSTEYLSSWTVKGKRCREGTRKYLLAIEPLSDEEEQKIKDAVAQLISLGNGDSLHTNPKEEHKRDSSSTPRCQIKEDVNGCASGTKIQNKRVDQVHQARDRRDFPVNKRRFSEPPTDSEETLDWVLAKSKGKAPPAFTDETSPSNQSRDIGLSTNNGKKEFFPELDKIRIEQQNHSLYDEYSKGNVVVKNKRRSRKSIPMTSETEGKITPVDQKLEDLLTEETPEKFKCSTCDKTFSTHQALGGHRSSHNKLKINVQNFDGSSPFPVGDENHANSVSQNLETYEIGEASSSKLVGNIHQCKICKKTFSTGQALGGHKRCHWTGLPSKVASPEAEDTQASGRKVLKFDLNEPAEMEDAKNI